jgi:hypothetical protein
MRSTWNWATTPWRCSKRWGKRWGFKRLKANVLLAMAGKSHFPINLILMEILGGVMGVRAYRRSVRKVKNDGLRFKKLGMLPKESQRAALPIAPTPAPAPVTKPKKKPGRAAA